MSIILVIALDSLHNNFEITTAPFFYMGNKDLEKIQLIIISTEVANLAKQAISIIGVKHFDKKCNESTNLELLYLN